MLALTLQREDSSHAFACSIRQRDGVAVLDFARHDPHKRLASRLSDMFCLEHQRRLPVGSRALCSCIELGQFVAQRLQQASHARAIFRRTEKYRHDLNATEFIREISQNVFAARIVFVDQLFHQSVVEVRHLLEHAIARFNLASLFLFGNLDQLGWPAGFVSVGTLKGEIDVAEYA